MAFFNLVSFILVGLLIFEYIKSFISFSITLPCLLLPLISLISTPSSLANLRALGLAAETPEALFSIKFFAGLSFIIVSFLVGIFSSSFSILEFS